MPRKRYTPEEIAEGRQAMERDRSRGGFAILVKAGLRQP
jgi:hypothetical protein